MKAIEADIPTTTQYLNELKQMNSYLERCKPSDRPTIQTSAPGKQSVFHASIVYNGGLHLKLAVHPLGKPQNFGNTRWIKVSPETWRRVYQEIKEKASQ